MGQWRRRPKQLMALLVPLLGLEEVVWKQMLDTWKRLHLLNSADDAASGGRWWEEGEKEGSRGLAMSYL